MTTESLPPLRLSAARVRRFRALDDISVSLRPITFLIGENNVGKSGLLRALDVALGAQPFADDFQVRADGTRVGDFVVDLRFEPWTGAEFEQVVADIVGTNMKGLAEPTQYFAWRAHGTIASDGSGVSVVRRYLTDWPGPESDDGPRLRQNDLALVSFFLLDAKRDFSDDQQSSRSFWGRLLSDIEITAELTTEIEAELRALSSKVVGSSEVLAAARADLGRLMATLGSSVRNVDIEPLPARVVEVARSVDVVVGSPSGHSLPMRLQGQGTRSVAAVLAFQAFTDLRLGKGEIRPAVIAGFEEPEAHLHPQAQRAMFGLLERMPGQRIISSHSGLVSRHAELPQVIIMRQAKTGIECLQVGEADLSPPVLSHADRERLERLLLRPHSECLFARLVILVEGDTEELALPVLGAYALGCDLAAAGVSVINAGGAQSFKHFVRLLDLLKVPFVVLADGDGAGKDGVADAAAHVGGALMPDELVFLPDGLDFEAYLLAVGLADEVRTSIAETSGPDALELWGSPRDGAMRKDGSVRNYTTGPGAVTELLLDYCRGNKGLYAAPAAQAIVASLASSGCEVPVRTLPHPLSKLFETVMRRVWGSVPRG